MSVFVCLICCLFACVCVWCVVFVVCVDDYCVLLVRLFVCMLV